MPAPVGPRPDARYRLRDARLGASNPTLAITPATAIRGTAGLGKTTIAAWGANDARVWSRFADRFPNTVHRMACTMGHADEGKVARSRPALSREPSLSQGLVRSLSGLSVSEPLVQVADLPPELGQCIAGWHLQEPREAAALPCACQ